MAPPLTALTACGGDDASADTSGTDTGGTAATPGADTSADDTNAGPTGGPTGDDDGMTTGDDGMTTGDDGMPLRGRSSSPSCYVPATPIKKPLFPGAWEWRRRESNPGPVA